MGRQSLMSIIRTYANLSALKDKYLWKGIQKRIYKSNLENIIGHFFIQSHF